MSTECVIKELMDEMKLETSLDMVGVRVSLLRTSMLSDVIRFLKLETFDPKRKLFLQGM